MNSHPVQAKVQAGLKRRYRAEQRFRAFGLAAVLAGISFVGFLFFSIGSTGYTVFTQTYLQLDIDFSAEVLDPDGHGDPDVLSAANYGALVKESMRARFPEVEGRRRPAGPERAGQQWCGVRAA